MRRHPTGELPHSKCVVLGVIHVLILSGVQILDASQIATSSRLSENDETADISNLPDVPDEDKKEDTPPNHSTRGLLPEWDAFGLHDQLLRALHHLSFTKPTPIQSKALRPALQGKDVVGVAETVRARLHSLPLDTYIGTGIGKNPGVWVAGPAQTPLAKEALGPEDP